MNDDGNISKLNFVSFQTVFSIVKFRFVSFRTAFHRVKFRFGSLYPNKIRSEHPNLSRP